MASPANSFLVSVLWPRQDTSCWPSLSPQPKMCFFLTRVSSLSAVLHFHLVRCSLISRAGWLPFPPFDLSLCLQKHLRNPATFTGKKTGTKTCFSGSRTQVSTFHPVRFDLHCVARSLTSGSLFFFLGCKTHLKIFSVSWCDLDKLPSIADWEMKSFCKELHSTFLPMIFFILQLI